MSYDVSEIFVPGGVPEYTYVTRGEKQLEEQLSASVEAAHKLITVTGMTKSGKTVLVNKIFPKDQTIWIEGGTVSSENEFWMSLLLELDGFTEKTIQYEKQSEKGIEGKLGVDGGIPFVAAGKGEIGSTYKSTSGELVEYNLALTPKIAAIAIIKKKKVPLIIDDFHYLNRTLQGKTVRALKAIVYYGNPVIFIAIPHRRYDAIKVEREMIGRLVEIHVPQWDRDELIQIPNIGFPLLNVKANEKVCEQMANEAYGSPHLMQEFCLELARVNHIINSDHKEIIIDKLPNDIFSKVADQTGRIIYDKLAKGPRQRSDRLQRRLKNGTTADIYKVTLLALAHLKPGLDTIDYEQLRSSIKELLSDNIPSAHEVTRVIDQISNIALSDESSTPVLDWEKDEQLLHITDPFFAFYLKWGVQGR